MAGALQGGASAQPAPQIEARAEAHAAALRIATAAVKRDQQGSGRRTGLARIDNEVFTGGDPDLDPVPLRPGAARGREERPRAVGPMPPGAPAGKGQNGQAGEADAVQRVHDQRSRVSEIPKVRGVLT